VEAFILMWLRAAGLVGQALALGGAIFALLVLRGEGAPDAGRALDRALRLTLAGAALVAAAEVGVLLALSAAFGDERGWPVRSVLESRTGTVGLIRLAAAVVVAAAVYLRRRPRPTRGGWPLLLGATSALPLTGALVSHATGTVDAAAWLVAVSTVHQAAAAAWVGGLICALAVAMRADAGGAARRLRRFSWMAAASVTALALTGIALSLIYIGSAAAAIGTSYGAMVLAKIALFAALVSMAWLNHRAVHGGLAPGRGGAGRVPDQAQALALRPRLEAECALAVVALVLAASIGSTPPANDPATPPATLAEIARVVTPGWPRLESPTAAEMRAVPGLGDPYAPRAPEQIAWSEFGHNVSGLFVVAMGVLATLEGTGRVPWARHWPLLIVALTCFVAWSVDPEGWQTGRVGFWAQLLSPEVIQHRMMLALTAMFGVAEWWVRTRRGSTSRWRYAFPVVCLGAGTLLITHVHELGNPKWAFLMELTHLPLGLLLLTAGWARWLELRLPPGPGVGHGRVWGPALMLFGLLLVFYREG
jgi:putative copper resistance protein D